MWKFSSIMERLTPSRRESIKTILLLSMCMVLLRDVTIWSTTELDDPSNTRFRIRRGDPSFKWAVRTSYPSILK